MCKTVGVTAYATSLQWTHTFFIFKAASFICDQVACLSLASFWAHQAFIFNAASFISGPVSCLSLESFCAKFRIWSWWFGLDFASLDTKKVVASFKSWKWMYDWPAANVSFSIPFGLQFSWESLGTAKKHKQASYGQVSSWTNRWMASSGIASQSGHLLLQLRRSVLGLQLKQKANPV